jgi:hypothetical protein
MHIGIDFDNTIICYDKVFHKIASEQGLIPNDIPASKQGIRDYLRQVGKENAWIKLQGYVYGPGIDGAELFPGVFEFFWFCRKNSIPVCIVSHRTRYPYLGPKYDLHRSAYGWMKKNNFFEVEKTGLTTQQVFLELTREKKIDRVKQLGCSDFIDDLPEFFCEPSFPKNVTCILFDPNKNYASEGSFCRCSTWDEIIRRFRAMLKSKGQALQV